MIRKIKKIKNKVVYAEIGYWDKNGKARWKMFPEDKCTVFAVNIVTDKNEDYAYRHKDLRIRYKKLKKGR